MIDDVLGSVLDDPNVERIELADKEVYLVGTAHVSKASVELAERVIRAVEPQSVAVELCQSRFAALKDPDRWKNTDILSVIKDGKAYLLLGQLILGGFQRRIGKQLGVKPGEEMMRAVTVAEELDIPVVLADREISITLRRAWASLGFWQVLQMMWSLVTGLFSSETIDAEEIERLKSADVLEEAVNELSGAMPSVRTALIDERDQYLAARIARARGQKVVAIVGAGHVSGIRTYIHEDLDLAPLEQLPKPSAWSKIAGWAIPLAIVAIIVWGCLHFGGVEGWKMFQLWALITASAGAVGSALALAHPVTILAAFLVAPLAALHPLIASGWVAGLVEAFLRKPRVTDFESLADEASTFTGFWRNRVSRILLVMVLTNLSVALGSLVGGTAALVHHF